MGRYFDTKQQECFGTALANFLVRYGGIFGEDTPSPEEALQNYWKQPFVEFDGATDALFVPRLTRALTNGCYDAKVTLTLDPNYASLTEKYGGEIGMLLADEQRRGNFVRVEKIKRVQVPCIALLENTIDIVNSSEKYSFNAHAVLALGNHIYIDYGQFIHDDKVKIMGVIELSLQRNPLKEMCEERKIKYEEPEPLIWEL